MTGYPSGGLVDRREGCVAKAKQFSHAAIKQCDNLTIDPLPIHRVAFTRIFAALF
jgi:hypothetical protein